MHMNKRFIRMIKNQAHSTSDVGKNKNLTFEYMEKIGIYS